MLNLAQNLTITNTATDPDYNVDEITAVIESIHENELITHTVSEYEIYKLLTSVNKTAPGSDNIPYWIFKHCSVELTCVIASLVNKTLSAGKPPSAWKSALVL